LTSACCCCANGDRGVSVVNGGFEDGILEPWAQYQSPQAAVVTVHSGNFGLAESGTTGAVFQDVKGLEPGVGYTISAWVSSSPDATAAAQIVVWDAGNNVSTLSNKVTPNGGWQLLKYEFKVSGKSRGIARIHLARDGGSGTIFWDDVRIARTD